MITVPKWVWYFWWVAGFTVGFGVGGLVTAALGAA